MSRAGTKLQSVRTHRTLNGAHIAVLRGSDLQEWAREKVAAVFTVPLP